MKKMLLLLPCYLLAASYCFGQWNQLDLSGTTWKLEDIYCTDKDTCFVVGPDGFILKTTDGGSNWTQLTSGTTNWLTGVYFMSSNVGIAVGDDIILKTTDAGANWAIKPKPFGSNGMCVHFYGDSVGYVGGPGGGQILKTTDAGETWNWSNIIGPNGPVNSVYFTDKDTGYAAEFVFPINGRIWKTNNGGSSWTQIFTYSEELRDVFFVNNSIGYVVGYSGTILKTTDAGNNWDTLTSGITEGLNSVYCVDADTCYAVGFDIILKTNDGGSTWNIQSISPPPAGLYSLYAVFFPSASIGYTVGRQGNAYALKIGGGVGIKETIAGNLDYLIYPNPTEGKFRVESPDSYREEFGVEKVEVFDLFGRKVLESKEQEIDMSSYPAGLYIWRVGEARGKVIIE